MLFRSVRVMGAAVATYMRATAICIPTPVTPLKYHEVELGWKKEEASVRREDGGCDGVWRCPVITSSRLGGKLLALILT